MRLYRLKFDGISAQKKQINVPTESTFKLGIEIAGYDDFKRMRRERERERERALNA